MNIINYIRDSISELHKVSWPTRRQAVRIAAIVLSVTFATALILGFFDAGLTWVNNQLFDFAATHKLTPEATTNNDTVTSEPITVETTPVTTTSTTPADTTAAE
jgi:preprotein translocase SecE subunit